MSDKKKINILMISSSSSLGGGTKHMFLLGSNLSRQFKIFYAIPQNSNFIKYLNSENHIEISERRLSLKDIIKLKKFIKLKSIDIIHSHGKGRGNRKIFIFSYQTTNLYFSWNSFEMPQLNED